MRLATFFAIAFGLGWSIALSFGSTHPLVAVALAGPAIAATIAAGLEGGRQGLAALYRRVLHARGAAPGWVMVFLVVPWLGVASARAFGVASRPSSGAALIAIAIAELGWRGYALPAL